MNEPRCVVNINSYGKIRIRLKELMDEKGITRYRMSKLADTRFEVVEKWYSGTVERIDADILARFCFVLGCQVGDIIQFENI